MFIPQELHKQNLEKSAPSLSPGSSYCYKFTGCVFWGKCGRPQVGSALIHSMDATNTGPLISPILSSAQGPCEDVGDMSVPDLVQGGYIYSYVV